MAAAAAVVVVVAAAAIQPTASVVVAAAAHRPQTLTMEQEAEAEEVPTPSRPTSPPTPFVSPAQRVAALTCWEMWEALALVLLLRSLEPLRAPQPYPSK